jgi:hypothetical protein
VLRLGLLAAPPLAMFYAIRPTLDALQEKPVTAGLPVVCLVVQVLLTFVLATAVDVAVAAMLAFAVAAGTLGLVSWLAVRRAVRQPP